LVVGIVYLFFVWLLRFKFKTNDQCTATGNKMHIIIIITDNSLMH